MLAFESVDFVQIRYSTRVVFGGGSVRVSEMNPRWIDGAREEDDMKREKSTIVSTREVTKIVLLTGLGLYSAA